MDELKVDKLEEEHFKNELIFKFSLSPMHFLKKTKQKKKVVKRKILMNQLIKRKNNDFL